MELEVYEYFIRPKIWRKKIKIYTVHFNKIDLNKNVHMILVLIYVFLRSYKFKILIDRILSF